MSTNGRVYNPDFFLHYPEKDPFSDEAQERLNKLIQDFLSTGMAFANGANVDHVRQSSDIIACDETSTSDNVALDDPAGESNVSGEEDEEEDEYPTHQLKSIDKGKGRDEREGPGVSGLWSHVTQSARSVPPLGANVIEVFDLSNDASSSDTGESARDDIEYEEREGSFEEYEDQDLADQEVLDDDEDEINSISSTGTEPPRAFNSPDIIHIYNSDEEDNAQAPSRSGHIRSDDDSEWILQTARDDDGDGDYDEGISHDPELDAEAVRDLFPRDDHIRTLDEERQLPNMCHELGKESDDEGGVIEDDEIYTKLPLVEASSADVQHVATEMPPVPSPNQLNGQYITGEVLLDPSHNEVNIQYIAAEMPSTPYKIPLSQDTMGTMMPDIVMDYSDNAIPSDYIVTGAAVDPISSATKTDFQQLDGIQEDSVTIIGHEGIVSAPEAASTDIMVTGFTSPAIFVPTIQEIAEPAPSPHIMPPSLTTNTIYTPEETEEPARSPRTMPPSLTTDTIFTPEEIEEPAPSPHIVPSTLTTDMILTPEEIEEPAPSPRIVPSTLTTNTIPTPEEIGEPAPQPHMVPSILTTNVIPTPGEIEDPAPPPHIVPSTLTMNTTSTLDENDDISDTASTTSSSSVVSRLLILRSPSPIAHLESRSPSVEPEVVPISADESFFSPPPIRPYVPHHHSHRAAVPTSPPIPASTQPQTPTSRKSPSPSLSISPSQPASAHMTRARCTDHKISFPAADGLLYFLVPRCSILNPEVEKDPGIIDCGVATKAEVKNAVGDLEAIGLDSATLGVIRQLTGVTLMREGQVGYLPRPGELIGPRVKPKASRVPPPESFHNPEIDVEILGPRGISSPHILPENLNFATQSDSDSPETSVHDGSVYEPSSGSEGETEKHENRRRLKRKKGQSSTGKQSGEMDLPSPKKRKK